jgi:hypothetical protein
MTKPGPVPGVRHSAAFAARFVEAQGDLPNIDELRPRFNPVLLLIG